MNTTTEQMDLLGKELLHDTDPTEQALLESWMASEPDRERLHQLLSQIEVAPSVSEYAEEARANILRQVNARIDASLRHRLWSKIAAVAAVFLLLLSTAGYFSYQAGYKTQNSQLVRLENPLGTKSHVTLPDGSQVTLNAGTILIYPTAFVAKRREVEIQGEAFFEIVHDAGHPFIVKAQEVNVQVLGTQFNVKAYEDEDNIAVTLKEGSVALSIRNKPDQIEMKPGEQVTFHKTNRHISRQKVDQFLFTSWKENKFYFAGITFGNIARQLERNFNVNIHITSEKLRNTVFTGEFTQGENLEQILQTMTLDKRIKYQIKGDQIYISEK